LIKSWSRHSLVWINSWEQDGAAPLHREWRGMVYNMGEDITFAEARGKFVGVDEDFGLLLRTDETTTLHPLSDLLKDI
jgi:BirA family biotin operon repressor/biotin-[acetyl-CoA-carboxylase] ligase